VAATNRGLRRAYTLWATFYDAATCFLRWSRRRSFGLLGLRPEESVLLVGCGTGADFEFLPPGGRAVAVDLTPAMLRKARGRIGGRRIRLAEMDAMRLGFPDDAFDAAVLHLILAVVPDPVAALLEAERVTRPGGRLVVLDKFWNRPAPPPLPLRALNRLLGGYVTHVSRSFPAILAATSLRLLRECPLAVGDLYMLYLLEKPGRGGRPAAPAGKTPRSGVELSSRTRSPARARPETGGRRMAMPTYEFQCTACQKEFTVTLTVKEREATKPACPACGSKELEPLMTGFFSKTSRKS